MRNGDARSVAREFVVRALCFERTAVDSLCACNERVAEQFHRDNIGELKSKFDDFLRHSSTGLAENLSVDLLHRFDVARRISTTRHLHMIVTAHLRRHSFDDEKRRNVFRAARESANKCARPHSDEVMKRRTAADVRTSLDMHMAREHDFVRNRDFIFELAIVRNMHADHEEIAIADGSGTTAVGSTTVHRHVFTNVIAVTELKPR